MNVIICSDDGIRRRIPAGKIPAASYLFGWHTGEN